MKLSNLLFFLILFFGKVSGFSQNKPTNDSIRIEFFLNESVRYQGKNPDSSFYYADKALKDAHKTGSSKYLSLANQRLGRYYISKENFGVAANHFITALKLEEKRKDESRIADLNDDLGRIYSLLEKFEKSLGYYNQSLSYYLNKNDTLNIAKMYSHIGQLYSSREYCETRSYEQKVRDYNDAIGYFEKTMQLCEKIGAKPGIINAYLNLASIYNRMQKPEKALTYGLKAMDYYKQENDWNGISETFYTLGITYRRLKQYQKAADCLNEAIHIGKRLNITEGIQFVYSELAQVYEDAGEYKKSLASYITYMTIRDSVYNNEKSRQIFELETKYQTEKKEREILALEVDKKRKSDFIVFLLLASAVIAMGAVVLVSKNRNKRMIAEKKSKIHKQKIAELEKDRQLVAVNALLHGEETERGRLARDLHDGLGGLLSGIKLSLTSMKGNMVLPGERVAQFDHALGLLDSSIGELRRVAHNMMPEALAKFGLKDALSDFCDGLGNTSELDVKFQFFGNPNRLEQKYEIGLYRIAQELINNALKHSGATEILVQLVQEEQRVNLTVQDNGKGFDINNLKTSKGSGLANIRSRIESLNGTIDSNTEVGKGSEFLVEFNWS